MDGHDASSLRHRNEGPRRGRSFLRGIATVLALWSALFLVPSASSDPASPPEISLSIAGTLGNNGWYTSNVTVAWSVSDPTGISGSTGCGTTSLTGDTEGTTLACSASNNATPPLSSSVSVTIKIDKTSPEVTGGTPERGPDANGWYNHPVSFSFAGGDALSGLDSCSPSTFGGPDSESASVTGTCRDKAGNSASRSFGLKYDGTPPTVTGASADRPPDGGDWYNHPVTVSFAGTDAASGIDSCTSATYGGPDGNAAAIAGTCRDKAGNTGTGSFTVRYDSTPPVLSAVSAVSGDGLVTLRWKSSSETDTAVTLRSPRGRAAAAKVVFRGVAASYDDRTVKDGLEYVYVVQTFDPAGNASQKLSALALPKVVTLRKMSYVPRVASAPTLRWAKVRKASYYHVQLFRGKRRILALWPARPELLLHASWTYAGRRYHLQPGRYRWYAWAGFGRRDAERFKAIGKAEFVVVRG